MFRTHIKLFVLTMLVLGMVTTSAFTQRGGFDTEKMFKSLSGGKDFIVASEVTVPREMSFFMKTDTLRADLTKYLENKGVKDGKMTLEQYKDYSIESRANRTFGFYVKASSLPESSTHIDISKLKLDRRMTMGQDPETIISGLKAFLEQKGVKDGKMTRELFVEHSKIREAERTKGDSKDSKKETLKASEKKDEGKPKATESTTTTRSKALPKELPSWFADLDKDKDSQVGLYEWKSGTKPIAEFVAMDGNADGLLTVEEVVRFLKAVSAAKDGGKSLLAASTTRLSSDGSSDKSKTETKTKGPKMKGKGKR